MRLRGLLIGLVLSAVAPGCGPAGGPAPGASASGSAAPAGASASAAASADEPPTPWIGIDRKRAEVEKVLNPKGEAPYAGKTGTVRGRITLVGDAPPAASHTFAPECGEGAAAYGKAFRLGQAEKGQPAPLGDALVAITGYQGFVPPKEAVVKATVRGCAFDRRTYALAYGQRIEVSNLDSRTPYMPTLQGAVMRAHMVAMPQGNPVMLKPVEPGATHYLLRDQMKRPYMAADVFVLKYATHAVTGLDGLYEITGVPVGKARIDALLPITNKSEGKDIEITEGVTEVNLTLRFDAKTDALVPLPEDGLLGAPPAGASGAPSAGPAPSAAPRPE